MSSKPAPPVIEDGFESLLVDYAAPEDPVEVLMPNGKSFYFQIPVDVTKQKAFEAAKRQFIDKMKAGKDLPAAMKKAVSGHSDEALGLAFTIHYMAVKPPCEQITALNLLKAPFLVEYVEKQLEAHRIAKTSAQIAEAVEKGKKELSETTSGDSS